MTDKLEITNSEAKNFRLSVLSILNKWDGKYSRSLEEYLRSLWVVIEKYKDQPASYQLFTTLIAEAFETEPQAFDSMWLEYDKEILWDLVNGIYIIGNYDDLKLAEQTIDAYFILKHTILYQIADLYRMQGEPEKDPYSYFGIDSPTGAHWYNFTVFTYWECATAGMEDHLKSWSAIAHLFKTCTWATLAKLLVLGSMYE
jgi:hypothetical protein